MARSSAPWPRPVAALLTTRGLRATADGLVAASLAFYLSERGLSERSIGLFLTATLIGSATIVAVGGVRPDRWPPRRMLLASSALMVLVGVAFALGAPIIVLAALAVVGPLNPGGGDVSAFLPAEQTVIAMHAPTERRTAAFARLTIVAALGATVGGAGVAVPHWLEASRGWSRTASLSAVFLAYAAIGLIVLITYAARVPRVDVVAPGDRQQPLRESRPVVRSLALLFALDSAGGGFVLSALLALWLDRRFGFDLAQLGYTLAAMSLLGAISALMAPRIVRRVGHVRAMVFTHVPAQLCLLGAAFAPNAHVAVGLLMLRALTATLDVPARTAFVMSVVTPAERAAAAAFTNIPRSLAAAATPALAGLMLARSSFGWPLLCGALVKLLYDGLLYARFRNVAAPFAEQQR